MNENNPAGCITWDKSFKWNTTEREADHKLREREKLAFE